MDFCSNKSNGRIVVSVVTDIHAKREKYSWQYIKQNGEDRRTYIKLFIESQRGLLAKNEAGQLSLSLLEKKLDYTQLRLYRALARVTMKEQQLTAPASTSASISQAAQAASGWVSSWFKPSAGGQPTENELTEEHLKELKSTIDYDDENALQEFDIPQETKQLLITYKLKSGSLTLKQNARTSNTSVRRNADYLLKFAMEELGGQYLARPTSYRAALGMGNLVLYDGTAEKGCAFEKLISARRDGGLHRQYLSTESLSTEGHQFFHMTFEQKPLDGSADSAFELLSMPLQVVVHREILDIVTATFRLVENDGLDMFMVCNWLLSLALVCLGGGE